MALTNAERVARSLENTGKKQIKIVLDADMRQKLDEIAAFLERHAQGSLPGTVRALLDDLEQRSGRLRDLGTVRMIECTDPETARMLLLDPKLILIDEPSIGLSPTMVQEVFAILKGLRDNGVTVLLIEQNAKQALQASDYGLVLEQGQTRIEDTAVKILADARIAQLFLGGGLSQPEPVS